MATSRSHRSPLGFDPFARAAAPVAPAAPVQPPAQAAPVRKARAVSTAPSDTKVSPASKGAAQADLKSRVAQAVRVVPIGGAEARTALPRPEQIRDTLSEIHQQLQQLQAQVQSVPLPEDLRADRPQLQGLLGDLTDWFSPRRYLDFWFEFVLASRSEEIDPFGLDPKFEARVEQLLEFLYRRWWRVQAVDVHNVPSDGRALLVSNHSGVLPYDGAMIKMAVRLEHPARRRVRFLVENFVYYFPFLGTFIYRFGSVRASQQNARMLLRKDEVVAVFPEGVKGLGKLYSERYQLQRFGRGGFITLASETHSPMVPVAVIGAEEILPMVGRSRILARAFGVPYFPITPTFPWLGVLGMIPYPTKWTIRFGAPFSIGDAPVQSQELWLHENSLKVRKMIQELIYLQLQERRSVFFG